MLLRGKKRKGRGFCRVAAYRGEGLRGRHSRCRRPHAVDALSLRSTFALEFHYVVCFDGHFTGTAAVHDVAEVRLRVEACPSNKAQGFDEVASGHIARADASNLPSAPKARRRRTHLDTPHIHTLLRPDFSLEQQPWHVTDRTLRICFSGRQVWSVLFLSFLHH